MGIFGKIVLATLPLVLAGFAAASGITYYLSRSALRDIAEVWLETRGMEAVSAARDQASFLEAYSLDTIEASVRQAQGDAMAIMSKIDVGSEGFVLVIDGSGKIVQALESSLIGTVVEGESWFIEMKGRSNGQVALDLDDKPYLSSYYYFEPWQWYVVATAPES
jgi:hypothetical protein